MKEKITESMVKATGAQTPASILLMEPLKIRSL
jgi:hypothetical protein